MAAFSESYIESCAGTSPTVVSKATGTVRTEYLKFSKGAEARTAKVIVKLGELLGSYGMSITKPEARKRDWPRYLRSLRK